MAVGQGGLGGIMKHIICKDNTVIFRLMKKPQPVSSLTREGRAQWLFPGPGNRQQVCSSSKELCTNQATTVENEYNIHKSSIQKYHRFCISFPK
ncbi:hypothetical protein E2C01_026322 [Portunus trituberculatus]|uniref:Uncharacterized protein n=1 Tax=Portunus trituberculatus TaxID=210409 RepID=A0A5B7EKM0_PORTR|nr:hypothetical protein [Portunus trituberculatus]